MRGKSHHQLGLYLAKHFLAGSPRWCVTAFLLGCTQPDKNPATYLKGSIRCQWLRGHNWGNSQRYIARLAHRLESRRKLRLMDFYTLGKLIHYIADSFTCAHNDHFGLGLREHQKYEQALQQYFLDYLQQRRHLRRGTDGKVAEVIHRFHEEYAALPCNIRTDSRYCVLVSSIAVCMLVAKCTLRPCVPGL